MVATAELLRGEWLGKPDRVEGELKTGAALIPYWQDGRCRPCYNTATLFKSSHLLLPETGRVQFSLFEIEMM